MNAANLHLLVTHLPIAGFAIGLFLLCATMARRGDRGMFLASVLVLVISGTGAVAAQLTGEPTEAVMEHLEDVPEGLIETHAKSALVATILAGITILLALVLCVVALRREGRIGILPLAILLLATLVTCVAMTRTGATGGQIHHSEIRG